MFFDYDCISNHYRLTNLLYCSWETSMKKIFFLKVPFTIEDAEYSDAFARSGI